MIFRKVSGKIAWVEMLPCMIPCHLIATLKHLPTMLCGSAMKFLYRSLVSLVIMLFYHNSLTCCTAVYDQFKISRQCNHVADKLDLQNLAKVAYVVGKNLFNCWLFHLFGFVPRPIGSGKYLGECSLSKRQKLCLIGQDRAFCDLNFTKVYWRFEISTKKHIPN